MHTGQPRAYFWNRFSTPHLSIVAAVEGGGHEFIFEGASVRVKLPPAARAGDDDDARMRVLQWTADETPMYFEVRDVDVEVDQPNIPEILALVESSRPPAADAAVVNHAEALAARAFGYWLRIVRWRTRLWRLGRSSPRHRATWGGALYEHRTNRRLASEPPAIAVPNNGHLTLEHWADIQTTLAAHTPPPLYYDLYFDGRAHLEAEALPRAVVDFADAVEVLLKTVLDRRLSDHRYDAARRYLVQAPARTLLNGFASSLLDPCVAAVIREQRSVLEQLFVSRNDVLLSPHATSLTTADCSQFSDAIGALLSAGDQVLVRRDGV